MARRRWRFRLGSGDAWPLRVLAGFDLEATGADPLTDRIVSAAVCRTDSDARLWLVFGAIPTTAAIAR